MATADDGYPSIADQKSIISAFLNSTLIVIYLTGAYTAFFSATVYMYLSNRIHSAANGRTIVCSLIGLFFAAAGPTYIGWYFGALVFCTQGDSRISIYNGSLAWPLLEPYQFFLVVLFNVLAYSALLICDGLMIWRCFIGTGRSAKRLAFLLTLFVIELALAFGTIILNTLTAHDPFNVSFEMARSSIIVTAVFGVSNIAASVIPTFMICQHIYLSTHGNKRWRHRYRYIIEILIQSSALYTFSSALMAIACFLSTSVVIQGHSGVAVFLLYAEATNTIIAGIAPTIMVARIITSSDTENMDSSLLGLSLDLRTETSNIVDPGHIEGERIAQGDV